MRYLCASVDRARSKVYFLDIDPHRDTPVEILHVVLLGFVKYFWRDAVSRLTDDQKAILRYRLNSVDLSGLDPSVSALRGQTLVQYSGSLVGRDFKILQQVAIFVLYDLLDSDIIEAWAALANLGPLIWQPEIHSLDTYMVSTRCCSSHSHVPSELIPAI